MHFRPAPGVPRNVTSFTGEMPPGHISREIFTNLLEITKHRYGLTIPANVYYFYRISVYYN